LVSGAAAAALCARIRLGDESARPGTAPGGDFFRPRGKNRNAAAALFFPARRFSQGDGAFPKLSGVKILLRRFAPHANENLTESSFGLTPNLRPALYNGFKIRKETSLAGWIGC